MLADLTSNVSDAANLSHLTDFKHAVIEKAGKAKRGSDSFAIRKYTWLLGSRLKLVTCCHGGFDCSELADSSVQKVKD
jgi:hypothetical protein